MTQKPPKALLLDMDGVLYHGDRCIPEALDFMRAVSSIPHCFVTNNPIKTPEQVADRLEQMGFVRPRLEQIITTAAVTTDYLYSENAQFRYFAIGAPGLDAALSQKGTADSENADYVVVGEGPGIDFSSLSTAINLILKKGAKLISTNPDASVDAYVDGEHQVWPGGGALVAPIVVATGVVPITIGKPHARLYQAAMSLLGVRAEECVMVGDRIDTDIAGAMAIGMPGALVRTGRFSPGDSLPEGMAVPDWDVENLQQLLDIWRFAFPAWLN